MYLFTAEEKHTHLNCLIFPLALGEDFCKFFCAEKQTNKKKLDLSMIPIHSGRCRKMSDLLPIFNISCLLYQWKCIFLLKATILSFKSAFKSKNCVDF